MHCGAAELIDAIVDALEARCTELRHRLKLMVASADSSDDDCYRIASAALSDECTFLASLIGEFGPWL